MTYRYFYLINDISQQCTYPEVPHLITREYLWSSGLCLALPSDFLSDCTLSVTPASDHNLIAVVSVTKCLRQCQVGIIASLHTHCEEAMVVFCHPQVLIVPLHPCASKCSYCCKIKFMINRRDEKYLMYYIHMFLQYDS